jgi:hypothetical protein
MVRVVRQLSKLSEGIRASADAATFQPKPKAWYKALRFADFLMLGKDFEKLENFVREVKCGWQGGFLIGWCTRLQQAFYIDCLAVAGGTRVHEALH